MRDLELEWRNPRCGLQLGLANSLRILLTNLRFADDLLIVGTSCSQIKHIHGDVICASQSHGFDLHPGKTKILTNICRRKGRPSGQVEVLLLSTEILEPCEAVKYLGRSLSFANTTEVEVENRISSATKKKAFGKKSLCVRPIRYQPDYACSTAL